MDSRAPTSRLDALLRDIDLPESAYASAERRYRDLGAWISAPDSVLRGHDAHVFVQGSFALGTAIRPVKTKRSTTLISVASCDVASAGKVIVKPS